MERWQEEWARHYTHLHQFITEPSTKPPGTQLDRKAFVLVNRLRTGWAKTAEYLHKIGVTDSQLCQCGLIQDIDHIIYECPIMKAPNGIHGIRELDKETIEWLNSIEDCW